MAGSPSRADSAEAGFLAVPLGLDTAVLEYEERGSGCRRSTDAAGSDEILSC